MLRRTVSVIAYLLWGVFVNVLNLWFITPSVEDYTILGVVMIFAVSAVWLLSIRPDARKRFVTFTIFSLLIGTGLSVLATVSLHKMIAMTIVMAIGLIVLAWLFARVKIAALVSTVVALVICNTVLPFTEWPFLTHFQIAYYGRLAISPADLPALPFMTVKEMNGTNALITLQNLHDTGASIQAAAQNAVQSPNALSDVLRNYQHRYTFVEIQDENGKFKLTPASTEALAQINPSEWVNSLFPFTRAFWTVENGYPVQYTTPIESAQTMASLALSPNSFPATILELSRKTEQEETTDWNNTLRTLGVEPDGSVLHIENGRLLGMAYGRAVDVPVNAFTVIGTGSFTAPHAHQVLVEGINQLQVVSLDGAERVLSTYHGSISAPLPNDIVVGPVDNSGRDVIFVNSSPATILQASRTNAWATLYTATSPSFRFETSVKFPGDNTPEIITDDPSYMRNAPTRYFTSYTYNHGQLVRNWRVYHTNVVNVQTVQFASNQPPVIVAAIYATGKFLILKRHQLPLIPAALVVLGLVIVGGFVNRVIGRRRRPIE